MKIYCEYCGGLQEDGAQVCPSCGARITYDAAQAAEKAKAEAEAAAKAAAEAAAQAERDAAEASSIPEEEDSPLETILDTVGKAATVLAGGSLLGGLFGSKKRKQPIAMPPQHSRFTAPRRVVTQHKHARPEMPMPGMHRPGPGMQRPGGHGAGGPGRRNGPGGRGGRGPGRR